MYMYYIKIATTFQNHPRLFYLSLTRSMLYQLLVIRTLQKYMYTFFPYKERNGNFPC